MQNIEQAISAIQTEIKERESLIESLGEKIQQTAASIGKLITTKESLQQLLPRQEQQEIPAAAIDPEIITTESAEDFPI